MNEEEAKRDVSSAIEEHIRRFADLLEYARRRHGLAPQDLDDLVQEVRIRLWRAQGTGEKISVLSSSYIYRTAMSAAVDLIRGHRHERRGVPLTENNPTQVDLTVDPPRPEAMDEVRAIGRALETLSRSRAVAVRMHLAGYSRKEIEGFLGWTEAKTRNLIYRGLADLRAKLTELGMGPEVEI
jgi:RNA polymerase sigma factor (sigma-70 family)